MVTHKSRNLYLDYIRALSALSVILFHYTTRYQELFGHKQSYSLNFPHGGKAVAIFFLLSGYFATVQLFYKKESAVQYAVKRFFKLFPVYWVSILLTFFVTLIFYPEESVSAKELCINFTMLQDSFGAAHVDGAYWTLRHELVFYFFIGIIILTNTRKHIDTMCISWTILQWIVILISNEKIAQINEILFFGTPHGQTFMSGIVIACLEKHYFEQGLKRKDALLLVLTLLGNIGLQYRYHDLHYAMVLAFAIVLVSICIVMHRYDIVLSAKKQRCVFMLKFLAGISYPLYLLHQNIGYIIIRKLENAGMVSEWFILVPFFIVVFLAWMVYRFVELPITKVGLRTSRKIHHLCTVYKIRFCRMDDAET